MRQTRCLALVFCLLALSAPALAQDAPPLTETYTAEHSYFQLMHPQGWEVEETLNGTVTLTSREGLTEADSLQPGDMMVIVSLTYPYEEWFGREFDTPADGLSLLIESATADYGDIKTFDVGGRPAARVEASDESFAALIALLELDDHLYASVNVFGHPDETDALRALALDVLASLEAGELPPETPPQEVEADTTSLTETFTSSDGRISFRYPQDWRVQTTLLANRFFIMNEHSVLGDQTAQPGEVVVTLNVLPASELPGAEDVLSERRWVNYFRERMTASQSSDSYTLQLGSLRLARSDFVEGPVEGILVAVRLQEATFAVLTMVAEPGNLPENEPVLYGIISTLTYTDEPEAADVK